MSQLPKQTESEQATQGTPEANSSCVELPLIPSKDMLMPSRAQKGCAVCGILMPWQSTASTC
eukprot:1142930-Pelagomonas_calceolata.AAC.1